MTKTVLAVALFFAACSGAVAYLFPDEQKTVAAIDVRQECKRVDFNTWDCTAAAALRGYRR